MKAWNLVVSLEHRSGELARVTEAFGEAHINIEGFATLIHDNRGWVQVLVSDEAGARGVFDRLGIHVEHAHEVIVETLANRPGALGEASRHLAEGKVNLTVCYLASDNRIVLGADDLATLRRVWDAMPAVAHR